MNKVILTITGEFIKSEVEVLSKTKNGEVISTEKYTAYDDKKKKDVIKYKNTYAQIPSIIWQTSEGNFNSETQLDKIKVVEQGFECRSEKSIEEIKQMLKAYAISHYESLQCTLEQRKETLRQNMQELETRQTNANKCVEIMRGVKL